MKKENRLSDLSPGEKAIISAFSNPDAGLRMIELGCIPGAEVQMIRRAPLGDPLAVRCAGTIVSLRRREASEILIRPC